MPFPLRRFLSAAVSTARLRLRLRRRGLSTSTSAAFPPWAIIHKAILANSPKPSSSLLFAEPPRTSHLLMPAHLVNPRLHPDAAWKPTGTLTLGGTVRATSGDGLLLLQFVDSVSTDPAVAKLRGSGSSESIPIVDMDPDVTRFVCNPVSSEVFRLPDIDGTQKVPIPWHPQGLLTRSVRGHGPPDKYAVAELTAHSGEGEGQSFVMRRFLSETGEWEKKVALPSPLPHPRRINMDHEVVAFAGRLYWVDLTWGAISVDPFSDRPELRFLELPWDSVVWPAPNAGEVAAQSMWRRLGVSEGKLRYVELSHGDPCYLLNSFVLGNDGKSWTPEHQVVFRRSWAGVGAKEHIPRIGAIDPLNAKITYLIIGRNSLALEMDTGKVLRRSMIDEVDEAVVGPNAFAFSAFLKPCLFPPWLASSRIPHAGAEFRMSIMDLVVQS